MQQPSPHHELNPADRRKLFGVAISVDQMTPNAIFQRAHRTVPVRIAQRAPQ
jgi:hypothetical protein